MQASPTDGNISPRPARGAGHISYNGHSAGQAAQLEPGMSEGHLVISPETVIRHVRAIILKEEESGFARLRRVPSTFTWKCLEHLERMAPPRRRQLFDDIAQRSPVILGLQPPPEKWQSAEMGRFYDEVLQLPSQHVSARLLRGMAASMRIDGPKGFFSNLPERMIREADSIRPTTAAKIRKVVKGEFEQRFGATADNLGGGNWLYSGQFSGRAFAVMIDYGGQVDQLRYFVQVSDVSTGLKSRTLNYETLVGLGFGRWDFVTADSQQENIQLLCELIEELLALPDRLLESADA